MKKWKMILIFVCICALLNFTSCGISNSRASGVVPKLITPKNVEQTTSKVKRGNIQKKASVSGTIEPKMQKNMSFNGVEGYLLKIDVKVGDTVKKGDTIAELNMDDIKYQIKEQKIHVQLAQADVDEAKSGVSQNEIKKAELNLQLEQLKLDKLNDSLNKSILKSDMNGIVTYVSDVNIGQHLEPFEILVTVADKSNIEVKCEKMDEGIKVGTKVDIFTNNNTCKGTVTGNVINKDKDKEITIIDFDKQPKDLSFGDIVHVEYAQSNAENVLIIPNSAISHGAGDHPYVRILKNGSMSEKYIDTGIDDGTNTEVTSGLSEGDEVICN